MDEMGGPYTISVSSDDDITQMGSAPIELGNDHRIEFIMEWSNNRSDWTMDKDHYKDVINDYISGKVKIQGEHPQDVMTAMDTFFHVGKMLMDNPEIDTVPPEYLNNLLKTLNKYPQYQELLQDLLHILKKHESPQTRSI